MLVGAPFTFIHAADLHLDSPFKGLTKVPDAVRVRLRESTFTALERLIDIVKQEKVDFVVLAGDLFDAADRSLRAQLRLQRALAEITELGIQVFIVHGNHDPLSGRQAKLDLPQGVHVFGSNEIECKPAYSQGGALVANVYGISYATSAVTDNLALRFRIQEGASFHLALLHANVDGNPSYDNYAPCKLDELVSAGFQYWALGHVHDRRTLHQYPHVVYPGNLQGRSIRETGAKGAYVVSVSEAGAITMQFRELADVMWQEIVVSIEGLQGEQELKNRLLAALEKQRMDAQGLPCIVRMRLEGRGMLHDRLLDPSVIEEWLEELRNWQTAPEETDAWIWPESLVIRTRGQLELDSALEEDGFIGELIRQGRAAAQSPEVSRAWVENAMDSLRKQPRIREWLDARSYEERAQWLERAMEMSVSLLRDEDAG